jgi:hypothetical protein
MDRFSQVICEPLCAARHLVSSGTNHVRSRPAACLIRGFHCPINLFYCVLCYKLGSVYLGDYAHKSSDGSENDFVHEVSSNFITVRFFLICVDTQLYLVSEG